MATRWCQQLIHVCVLVLQFLINVDDDGDRQVEQCVLIWQVSVKQTMMMVMVMPVRMTVVDLWALLPSMSSQVSAQSRRADDGDDDNDEANHDDDEA